MMFVVEGGGAKTATFKFNERRKKYCQIIG